MLRWPAGSSRSMRRIRCPLFILRDAGCACSSGRGRRPSRAAQALVVYGLAAYVPLQHVTRDFYMKAAFLPDRGVVKVSGNDARDFLNGLVTTDVTLLHPN